MENINYQSTADKTFMQLCDEVDYWKEKYLDMKRQKDELNIEYSQHLDRSLAQSKESIGQLLTLVLRSEQTENGILIRQD